MSEKNANSTKHTILNFCTKKAVKVHGFFYIINNGIIPLAYLHSPVS